MRLSKIGYKSLIIAGALTLFALPVFAATIIFSETYTSDSGFLYFKESADFVATSSGSFGDITIPNIAAFYLTNTAKLQIWDNGIITASSTIPITTGILTFPFNGAANFINGHTYKFRIQTDTIDFADDHIMRVSYNNISPTEAPLAFTAYQFELPPPPPLPANAVKIASSTAAAILTNVSDQLADEGFLWFAVISAGIVLGFWGMEKLLDLMPKDKI